MYYYHLMGITVTFFTIYWDVKLWAVHHHIFHHKTIIIFNCIPIRRCYLSRSENVEKN